MIRVIGLGSPFGDDDAGWRVIAAMRGHTDRHVDLVELDRPGALLVDRLLGSDHLVLVDALWVAGKVGRIRRLWPDELAAPAVDCGSHQLRLGDQLALARALGWHPRAIELWTISIASLDTHHPAVAGSVRALATLLIARLGEVARSDSGLPAPT